MKDKTDAELIAEAEKLRHEWAGNYGPFGPDERFNLLTALFAELAKRLKDSGKKLDLYALFYEHVKHENGGGMCEKEYEPCELCYPEAYDSCDGDVI